MKVKNQKFYIITRGDLYLIDSSGGYFKFGQTGKPKLFARKAEAKKQINHMINYCYNTLKVTEVKVSVEGV